MFHFDNLKSAEYYLDKSIELLKKNPFAYHYLAMIYNQQDKIEKSLEFSEKAIGYKPDFPEPYVTYAYLYSVKKK